MKKILLVVMAMVFLVIFSAQSYALNGFVFAEGNKNIPSRLMGGMLSDNQPGSDGLFTHTLYGNKDIDSYVNIMNNHLHEVGGYAHLEKSAGYYNLDRINLLVPLAALDRYIHVVKLPNGNTGGFGYKFYGVYRNDDGQLRAYTYNHEVFPGMRILTNLAKYLKAYSLEIEPVGFIKFPPIKNFQATVYLIYDRVDHGDNQYSDVFYLIRDDAIPSSPFQNLEFVEFAEITADIMTIINEMDNY